MQIFFFLGSKNQTLVYFFGGAISKALATILTYPYQVVRTNIHVFLSRIFFLKILKISNKHKMKFDEIFKEIYQNGGWKAFFKGKF